MTLGDTSLIDRVNKQLDSLLSGATEISNLIDQGWTQVLIYRQPILTIKEIETWCQENTRDYRHYGRGWIFKYESDAVLFTLRWV